MPKDNQTGQIINYVPNLNTLLGFIQIYSRNCPINNCNISNLIEIEQDSPEHLRFIPQCLDFQSNINRGMNRINIPPRATNLSHNQLYRGRGKTPIKRETYIEFSEQQSSQLMLRIVTFDPNALRIANSNTNLNVRIGRRTNNRIYFHIDTINLSPVIINPNNLQQNFNTQIPVFLDILRLLYP
mgnify:CR=1 FL=1